jgi:hypothetical protein
MKSIIKRVLNNEWSSLQTDVEKEVADKIKTKIDTAKVNVLAKLNGIDPAKQTEILNVSK